MNVFQTDADLIRHYAKELMEDGKECSVVDILAYIHQKHGERGLTGGMLDYKKVGSAFINLTLMERNDYVRVRRGVYRKLAPGERYSLENIYSKVSDILTKAEKDIHMCFAENFRLTEAPHEDIQSFWNTAQGILALLEQAIRLADVPQGELEKG